ncbi:NAD(P)H-binding protein [uncultured Cyclobacterium sp.]|uniref:NAD(P)H-binding protein n=1 Tax=uncultured Cyclobacterium sp. TaxID=453820 RepID=UPI0030EEA2C5
MTDNTNTNSIVILGASGAVGSEALKTLLANNNVHQLTLLGRTPISGIKKDNVYQHKINVSKPDSYQEFIPGHDIAICTLGVGEPSKISKEEFLKIDKEAVLEFAKACKKSGVRHFELLASVGISPKSSSFYLRAKGELVAALKALAFDRLSIFQPSMILTPTNRYGISQAIVLKVFPLLKPFLIGNLRKYRGIPVSVLGQSMAENIFIAGKDYEILQWDQFYSIIDKSNKIENH